MASGAEKSAAFSLLIINVILYSIVMVISAWSVNHGIEEARESASALQIEAKLFPIYFPFGNLATGFLIIFAFLAGIVGIITSITGIHNVMQWNVPNLHAAASSSMITLLLTLLAMGVACKEIHIGWTNPNLRTLEVMVIILSGTQLLCTGAIHAGVSDAVARESGR